MSDTERISELLAQCDDYLKRELYSEAKIAFESVLKINENNADAYKGLGNVYFYQERFEEAISFYKTATEKDPKHKIAYRAWGLALSKLKHYDEAIEKLEKAIEIDENYADAFCSLGNIHRDQGQFKKAIQEYVKANKIKPPHVYSLHNLAHIYQMLGKYSLAKKKWRIALDAYKKGEEEDIRIKNADHLFYEANIYFAIFKDYEQAKKLYNIGLSLNNENIDILIDLCELCLEQKTKCEYDADHSSKQNIYDLSQKARSYYNDALTILKKRVLKYPSVQYYLQLGNLYLLFKECKDAADSFEKALKLESDNREAFVGLGTIAMRNDDFKCAISYFSSALNQDQHDLLIKSNLAEACVKANILDKAEHDYRKILDITHYHIDSVIGLGNLYSVLGDNLRNENNNADAAAMYTDSIKYFNKSLKYSESCKGSKELNPKEKAGVYYSRGYSQVSLYESQHCKEEGILRKACEDFRKVPKADERYYKAKRAITKIKDKLNILSPNVLEGKLVPVILLIVSLCMVMGAQFLFFIGKPVWGETSYIIDGPVLDNLKKDSLREEVIRGVSMLKGNIYLQRDTFESALKQNLNEDQIKEWKNKIVSAADHGKVNSGFIPFDFPSYLLMTMVGIALLLIRPFIYQITRLKVAGIEIEKSPVDQISPSSSLGICK
jgi:tetratricopeptide (TPR) repeat protein